LTAPKKKLSKARCNILEIVSGYSGQLDPDNKLQEAIKKLSPSRRTIGPIPLIVVTSSGCWEKRGSTRGRGYGCVYYGGKLRVAHRWFYEELRGKIPNGLVLDHLCRNLTCVNPAHLEAVTQRENTLRGVGPIAVNFAKKACKRGHPFDEKNTIITDEKMGHRTCRACQNKSWRKHYAKVSAEDCDWTGKS
jgi:hypothetical protein